MQIKWQYLGRASSSPPLPRELSTETKQSTQLAVNNTADSRVDAKTESLEEPVTTIQATTLDRLGLDGMARVEKVPSEGHDDNLPKNILYRTTVHAEMNGQLYTLDIYFPKEILTRGKYISEEVRIERERLLDSGLVERELILYPFIQGLNRLKMSSGSSGLEGTKKAVEVIERVAREGKKIVFVAAHGGLGPTGDFSIAANKGEPLPVYKLINYLSTVYDNVEAGVIYFNACNPRIPLREIESKLENKTIPVVLHTSKNRFLMNSADIF